MPICRIALHTSDFRPGDIRIDFKRITGFRVRMPRPAQVVFIKHAEKEPSDYTEIAHFVSNIVMCAKTIRHSSLPPTVDAIKPKRDQIAISELSDKHVLWDLRS